MPKWSSAFLIALFAAYASSSSAAELTLAWDASSDGAATGYTIFYGTASHTYFQQVNVGNSTSHTVTGLNVGTTYYFAVRAYDATGLTSPFSNEIIATIAPMVPPAVTTLELTSSVPSPQVIGTTVSWLARATGGVGPYQYQWALYGGGKWIVYPWTTASSWLWKPTTPGNDYQVRVAVRSAGSSSMAGEMIQLVPFTISVLPFVVTLRPSVAAPQLVGSTIRWSAVASGGASGYQYRWFVFNGIAWTDSTGWTTSSTWSWAPILPNDSYIVAVWVRTAGSTIDAPETGASVPFAIKSSSAAACASGSVCK